MHRWLSLVLLFWLASSQTVWAVTSQLYFRPGTVLTFGDSAQAPSATWTLSALASGAGRLSAQVDKGANAQPGLYEIRCRLALTGTNVLNASVEFYVATSDGTNVDGALGTGDGALASDKRSNLLSVGTLIVDQTSSNTIMVASFRNIFIPERYFSLGVWNATTLPFQTSTSAHRCTVTPMNPEYQ